jgi:hypothetical protein
MMPDWMLPNITDYWDERVEAIERLSRVIAEAPEAERAAQLASITAAVGRHADALPEADLVKYAVPIVEDLYKAASKRSYLDEPLLQYLAAIGSPYFQALTARGYMVHYFIDNTYERLDGPALAFPLWFDAAGLFYICPQEIACTGFEKDKPREQWQALVTRYIADGRVAAEQLANRCHAAGRHFVYLDIDATDFAMALKPSGQPGVIHVFRNEAPIPGSRCVMRLPDGPRPAPASPAPAPAPPPASNKLKPLIDGLVGGDEEARRGHRRALAAALSEALIGATDLDALKPEVLAFRDAGWALIGTCNYGDGEYTLAAALRVLLGAIPRRPQLAAWLALIIEPRLKSFMQHPIADLNMAAWSTLDAAMDEAAKLDPPQ